jgi:hypothetical protein
MKDLNKLLEAYITYSNPKEKSYAYKIATDKQEYAKYRMKVEFILYAPDQSIKSASTIPDHLVKEGEDKKDFIKKESDTYHYPLTTADKGNLANWISDIVDQYGISANGRSVIAKDGIKFLSVDDARRTQAKETSANKVAIALKTGSKSIERIRSIRALLSDGTKLIAHKFNTVEELRQFIRFQMEEKLDEPASGSYYEIQHTKKKEINDLDALKNWNNAAEDFLKKQGNLKEWKEDLKDTNKGKLYRRVTYGMLKDYITKGRIPAVENSGDGKTAISVARPRSSYFNGNIPNAEKGKTSPNIFFIEIDADKLVGSREARGVKKPTQINEPIKRKLEQYKNVEVGSDGRNEFEERFDHDIPFNPKFVKIILSKANYDLLKEFGNIEKWNAQYPGIFKGYQAYKHSEFGIKSSDGTKVPTTDDIKKHRTEQPLSKTERKDVGELKKNILDRIKGLKK